MQETFTLKLSPLSLVLNPSCQPGQRARDCSLHVECGEEGYVLEGLLLEADGHIRVGAPGWIGFQISAQASDSQVRVLVRVRPTGKAMEDQGENQCRKQEVQQQNQQFSAVLTAQELFRMRPHRKRQLIFPILHRGSQVGESHFNLLIKTPNHDGKQLVPKHESSQALIQTTKSHPSLCNLNLQPVFSGQVVTITPELFTDEEQEGHSEPLSPVSPLPCHYQSYDYCSADFVNAGEETCDLSELLNKFETLNSKFNRKTKESDSSCPEHSIYDEEVTEEDEVNEGRFHRYASYDPRPHYETIEEEDESDGEPIDI